MPEPTRTPPQPHRALTPLRRSTYAKAPSPAASGPAGITNLLLRGLANRLPRRLRGRSMVSLIPLLTIGVFLLLAIHLYRLAVTVAETPTPPARPLIVRPVTEGVPPALPEVRYHVPIEPHNLQFGTPDSSLTLVLFTDPACLPCRDRTDAWLRPVTDAGIPVRLVIKYWPQRPGDLTGGQMMELARRQGVGKRYWQALSGLSPTTADASRLTDAQLFDAIERQGQSLLSLRVKLADEADSLTDTVAMDIDLGQRLRLPPPPVLLLNGYVLDGRPLQPERLATYLHRLSRGEALTAQADAYFAP